MIERRFGGIASVIPGDIDSQKTLLPSWSLEHGAGGSSG
jgi:hypothetical protein